MLTKVPAVDQFDNLLALTMPSDCLGVLLCILIQGGSPKYLCSFLKTPEAKRKICLFEGGVTPQNWFRFGGWLGEFGIVGGQVVHVSMCVHVCGFVCV